MKYLLCIFVLCLKLALNLSKETKYNYEIKFNEWDREMLDERIYIDNLLNNAYVVCDKLRNKLNESNIFSKLFHTGKIILSQLERSIHKVKLYFRIFKISPILGEHIQVLRESITHAKDWIRKNERVNWISRLNKTSNLQEQIDKLYDILLIVSKKLIDQNKFIESTELRNKALKIKKIFSIIKERDFDLSPSLRHLSVKLQNLLHESDHLIKLYLYVFNSVTDSPDDLIAEE